jgi:hypothetical protein
MYITFGLGASCSPLMNHTYVDRVESWLILPTNYTRNRIQWHPKQADHYYMSHYLVYNTVQIHIMTTVIFPFDQKDASTRTHPEFTQTQICFPQHFEENITMSIASIITS